MSEEDFAKEWVVDKEVTDNLGGNSKRGVAPRGRGTCEYKLKWA